MYYFSILQVLLLSTNIGVVDIEFPNVYGNHIISTEDTNSYKKGRRSKSRTLYPFEIDLNILRLQNSGSFSILLNT